MGVVVGGWQSRGQTYPFKRSAIRYRVDGTLPSYRTIKSMYSSAFRYHIRENGVRLLKFDNFRPLCYNPKHSHLPGVYSTEAIGDAVIGTLLDLDAERPDVFLMLYWGYRSPW